MFKNKNILVTGGTGYFGKNFVKHLITSHSPKRVVIFSRDEQKQYNFQNELKNKKKFKSLRFFIGDVRDIQRLNLAMKNIDIVIHAAALKHVPAAEYNPMECVKTNILGAQNVIETCLQNKVQKVIALSTDKAANPINIYGASKLVSDKLFTAANNLVGKNKIIFSVVRYGNVFDSTGSVVPYFKSLMKSKKSYIPITHPKMTRFVISIEEGIKFVIEALKVMRGGEIFVPKLPSIRIMDLAKAFSTSKNIKIIGIRSGEKLHEVLCPRDDAHLTFEFKNYYIIFPSIKFFKENKKDQKNLIGSGKKVKNDFQYDSANNINYLNITQIKKMIKNIKD